MDLTRLAYKGLSKPDFIRVNRLVLEQYLAAVTRWLSQQYGPAAHAVTLTDVWVLTACEAGIKPGGHVDPEFHHNLGEVGFFPLPSNIAFWNGPDAPPWDRFTSLERNVFHFLLYLGQLKSRKVRTLDGVALYSGLFSKAADLEQEKTGARILAGVVHGYFYSGNYSDGTPPISYLIDGYAANTEIGALMARTRYKLAGSSIIRNRGRNIEQALVEMTY